MSRNYTSHTMSQSLRQQIKTILVIITTLVVLRIIIWEYTQYIKIKGGMHTRTEQTQNVLKINFNSSVSGSSKHFVQKKSTFDAESTTHTGQKEGAVTTTALCILILACNRQNELEFALESWVQVDGIGDVPVRISVDCMPGVNINVSAWRARGLGKLEVVSSFQIDVNESGDQKARTDERVNRHWLSAVGRTLALYDHVLYTEEDHIVKYSILHDVDALLKVQKKCSDCFAVQLGCHDDCWGMATENRHAAAKMEPGNMGVVYSREQWAVLGKRIEEYCHIYGIWDINLHTFLHNDVRKYALTFLSSRIAHLPTCRSARTTEHFDQNCDKQRGFFDVFTTRGPWPRVSAEEIFVVERAVAPRKGPQIVADGETQRRCAEAYRATGPEHIKSIPIKNKTSRDVTRQIYKDGPKIQNFNSTSTENIKYSENDTISTSYHNFNCSELSNTRFTSKIGNGVTKTAFKIKIGDETLIAKRVSAESPDKRTRMGVYKLLKEAHILNILQQENTNAMRVKGVCIFSEDAEMNDFRNGVTVLYETQPRREIIPLNFEPWIVFLRRLYMSSLGSIIMTDTKIDQFTVIRGQINMHDMDDVFIEASRDKKGVQNNCNQIIKVIGVHIDNEKCLNMILQE